MMDFEHIDDMEMESPEQGTPAQWDAPASPAAAPAAARSDSPRALALAAIPIEWRERMIAEASAIGCRADDDVLWTVVSSVINAWASASAATHAAHAAEAAATAVRDAVGGIPDRVLEGASRAAADARGEIAQGVAQGVAALDQHFVAGGQAIVAAIHNASQRGASAIEAASGTLGAHLDQAVAQRVQSGADQFAQAAAQAAEQAARSALGRRAVGSLALAGALLAGAALLGAGATLGVMGPVLHRIAPAPIVQVNGKAGCGWISLSGEPNYVCGVKAPGPAPAGAPAAKPMR